MPTPLLHMLRHVPPRQLVRRASLLAKRRVRVAVERVAPGVVRRSVRAAPLPLSEWPRPILPPRTHLVEDGEARILDRRVPLRPPIDWTPAWAPPNTLGRIRLHEHEFLEGVDDATFAKVVSDWVDVVRPYGDKYWVDAWNAYALSLRTVVWMQQLAVRPDLPREPVAKARGSLARQLAFLHTNLETDLGGNHLIKDLKALLWGARCFGGEGVSAWTGTASRLLARELELQVPDDGLHMERSPAYHLQVFADLLEIHAVLPPGGLRDRLHAALDRMAFATAAITAPDGHPLLLGDGGLHMAYASADLLDAWEALGGERPRVPSVTALADAGLYLFRDGDDLFCMDAGPLACEALPAHGHADVLALTWSLGGRRFLVDQGVFEYQGPTRADSRATRSHNTLTLDDADQAELFGVFRAGRRWQVTRHAWMPRADGFVLTASHDGYRHMEGKPVHRRTVEVQGRRVRVEDRVEGGAGQRAVARLLLHPDVRAEPADGGLDLVRDDLVVRLRTEGRVSTSAAEWWPDFGVRKSCTRVEISYGESPCRGGFRLDASGG